MTDVFLLCRSCGALCDLEHSSLDSVPDDQRTSESDAHAFWLTHREHGLEQVMRLPTAAIYDRPAWDPVATAWFHVRTARDSLVVRSWRSSIEEPRRYTVETNPPPEAGWAVNFDEGLLRRAFDMHFYPHAIRPAKVDRFLSLVHDLVSQLEGATIDTSFDDVEHANTAIAPFPNDLCDTLVSRSATIFDSWELERVAAFVRTHRLENGALALHIEHRFRQHPLSQAGPEQSRRAAPEGSPEAQSKRRST